MLLANCLQDIARLEASYLQAVRTMRHLFMDYSSRSRGRSHAAQPPMPPPPPKAEVNIELGYSFIGGVPHMLN